MSRWLWAALAILLSLGVQAGCVALPLNPHPPVPKGEEVQGTRGGLVTLQPTPSRTGVTERTATATPRPTFTPSLTPTPSPTSTASATPSVTPTPLPPRLNASIDPPGIAQGHTGLVLIQSTLPVSLTGALDDRQLSFRADESGHYWAVFGVPALASPGMRTITLTAVDHLSRTVSASVSFDVVDAGYQTESITLPPDRLALLDPKLVQAEQEKLQAVFTIVTPRPLWGGVFTRPITTTLSSPFGIRRSYNGGPASSFHEGNDFRGPAGLPVTAPAAGRVVLAETLTVRGNAVVLDHGLGVFTGYWHMSQINVQPGDLVKPGQVIGRVGNTGLSTGAHLHWEMRIGNVYVDALEWTERAFPGD